MEKKTKDRLLHYGINGIIAVGIAVMVANYELKNYGYSTVNWFRFLCDGFFAAAVVYLGFGLLGLVAKAGNFYAFSYLFHVARTTFMSYKEPLAKKKSFYEYVEEKRAKDLSGNSKYHGRMLILGIVCLMVSMVFLGLFYKVV